MISVICVFNDSRALNAILAPSLKSQTAPCEHIFVDNSGNTFKSAADALNYGAEQAHGKYLMFAHQDVDLGSPTWLADVESLLDSLPRLGIAGPIGTEAGGVRGRICSCGEDTGQTLLKAEPVQTLDECALIIPSEVWHQFQFDGATFTGWHCYGADYCLTTQDAGYESYAIPAYIYHRSLARNETNLLQYQKKLWRKHHRNHPAIYTTCGTLTRFRIFIAPLSSAMRAHYFVLFPTWVDRMKRELRGCESILDLGCGYSSPVQHLPIPYKVGVEAFGPYLEESQKKAIHNEYIRADIRNVDFPAKSFDAVLASDVLEHLTREEGEALIDRMTSWAKKKVILFTPNGYVYQDDCDSNPLQIHQSGWTPSELRASGFRVQGMNGLKYLRGYRGEPRYKPKLLWHVVSDISNVPLRHVPGLAFQMLAIKDIGK